MFPAKNSTGHVNKFPHSSTKYKCKIFKIILYRIMSYQNFYKNKYILKGKINIRVEIQYINQVI
jgi:hypothetical protein